MVTVMITRDVRWLLEEYRMDGEFIDDAVNRLFDEVEDYMDKDMGFSSGSVNINIDRKTMARIKSFKIDNKDSYGRILLRALLLSEKLKQQ